MKIQQPPDSPAQMKGRKSKVLSCGYFMRKLTCFTRPAGRMKAGRAGETVLRTKDRMES